MSETLDISALKQQMSDRDISQSKLALACGLSQPHLSKVLSGKVKAGRRTTSALVWWMNNGSHKMETALVEQLTRKLNRASSDVRMQAMQILAALEKLVD